MGLIVIKKAKKVVKHEIYIKKKNHTRQGLGTQNNLSLQKRASIMNELIAL